MTTRSATPFLSWSAFSVASFSFLTLSSFTFVWLLEVDEMLAVSEADDSALDLFVEADCLPTSSHPGWKKTDYSRTYIQRDKSSHCFHKLMRLRDKMLNVHLLTNKVCDGYIPISMLHATAFTNTDLFICLYPKHKKENRWQYYVPKCTWKLGEWEENMCACVWERENLMTCLFKKQNREKLSVRVWMRKLLLKK